MKKQDYVLIFPKGMSGDKTINLRINPLLVKDVVTQIMVSQPLVFGDTCIVQDIHDNVLGIAYQGEKGGVRFFTEDDEVEQIKETEDNE